MIETELLYAYTPNLADMFTMTRGLNPIEFWGHKNKVTMDMN